MHDILQIALHKSATLGEIKEELRETWPGCDVKFVIEEDGGKSYVREASWRFLHFLR
jgi:hypothetical protein